MENPLKISEEFKREMTRRRSIRSFSNQDVDKQLILNAIHTAGSAPSGANRQPWYFAFIKSADIKAQIRKMAEEVERDFYYRKAPKQWIKDLEHLGTNSEKAYLTEAPALIAVFSRTKVDEDLKTYYPIESTGIAVGLLLTSLHKAGLATLTHTPKPMNFLNQVLKLDCTYRPFMIIVTGYPNLPVQLPDIKRKALQEIYCEY